MGILQNLRDSMSDESSSAFTVQGIKVECSHCGHTQFNKREAQLNTAGLTFLNLDWANQSAVVLVCRNCGKLEWFLGD